MLHFNEEFKRLRESRHLTQEQLAKELEVSRSSIGMYEKGQREPSFEMLEKIADYFNVPLGSLVDDYSRDNKYYMFPETARVAQELFENKEMRLLFDAAKDSDPEDLRMVRNMLIKLKKANN